MAPPVGMLISDARIHNSYFMKTAGRHPNTNEARPPFSAKANTATDPDRIIMSVSQGRGSDISYGHGMSAGEYTEFEEVTSSHAFDEIAFQEYADEDPARLRVTSRRSRD
jgi:hypothetical protein